MKRKGFTLIEMLVVLAIIAILITATTVGYSSFIRKAQNARGVELVLNVKTALEAILQADDAWPRAILSEGQSGNGELTATVGGVIAKRGGLSLTYKATTDANDETTYRLSGLDQCGIVSPWASDVIKRKLASGAVPDTTRVPSGGTVADHRLRFAIDTDYDGLTDVAVSAKGGTGGARVRASACVWCCGYDGKFGTKDDIYSWSPAQEVK